MIASMQDQLRDEITAMLGEIAVECAEDRVGSWRVRCTDRFQMTVSLDNEWLRLCAPFAMAHIHGEAVPRCAWEVLLRNALLPGAAKLVTAPDRDVIHATVELPLDPEANSLKEKLRQSILDLKRATRRHPSGKNLAARCHDGSEVPDLSALCTAAGWPFNARNENRIALQLETPGCFTQAILAWDDSLRATVNLHQLDRSLSALSRHALGIMLLQLGGWVRAVRPAVLVEPDHDLLVLQSCLGLNPSPGELSRILGALSVAAGMCQREVALLLDEQISSRYVSVRGCSVSGAVSE